MYGVDDGFFDVSVPLTMMIKKHHQWWSNPCEQLFGSTRLDGVYTLLMRYPVLMIILMFDCKGLKDINYSGKIEIILTVSQQTTFNVIGDMTINNIQVCNSIVSIQHSDI